MLLLKNKLHFMAIVNNTLIIRRELLTTMASMYKEDKLFDEIDMIPYNRTKRDAKSMRCCVHKERVVVKHKVMALLGYTIQEDRDELTPLSEYAIKSLARKEGETPILHVVDEACTSCVQANYVVTNLCKGCIARPCQMNCPKDSIYYDANGQAHINAKTCVNCGLCQKVCPYHSIVYMPVPCEEACPVNAIKKDEDGKERIDWSACILCGKCITACPFGSILETTDMLRMMFEMKKKKEVVAIVAPSIQGQFKAPLTNILDGIKMLGFKDVIEVAKGANSTTFNEAAELVEKLEEGQPFMTTSCCPSYVEAAKKHIPEILPFVSHTGSPMFYAAKLAREQHPNAKIMFIGPCVAKRKEAMDSGEVDYVMTFEELACLMQAYEVQLDQTPQLTLDTTILNHGRNYAIAGGVTASIRKHMPNLEFKDYLVDGINKKQLNLLKAYARKKSAPVQFIEVMSCQGGCIAGPSANLDFDAAKRAFEENRVEE